MIEAALVLTMLLALLFAMVDYGLVLFVRSTFQEAVREGVRYAVTYQTMSGMGQDDSIRTTVQNNAMGFLNASNASLITVTYTDPTTFATSTYNGPGNLVEVCIKNYQWNWAVPLLRSSTPLNFTVCSSDRMEGLPGGVSPPTR